LQARGARAWGYGAWNVMSFWFNFMNRKALVTAVDHHTSQRAQGLGIAQTAGF
jgi:hypothetical protein